MCYEKKNSNILVPKFQKVWRNAKVIGLSTFKIAGEKIKNHDHGQDIR